MLILVTIVLALALLMLMMRFVQPEIIYSIRRGLVMVDTNKVFIDKRAKRANVAARYKRLMVHDDRSETRIYDGDRVLYGRIIKISELYRLLDSRRDVVESPKPQVCIVELAALLTNLGGSVEANPEHNAPIVKASALLKYIANGVRASRNEPLYEGEEEIDSWFIDNPITIEQVIEMLSATVVGLLHRQQAARGNDGGHVSTVEPVDALAEIMKAEKRLRFLVRSQLQKKHKTEYAAYNRMRESLGEESYQACLKRMEDVRKHWSEITLDFFDFVDWKQLETLIVKDWDGFQPIFNDESWLKTRIQNIIQVRSDETSHLHVHDDDKKVVIDYCGEIQSRIDDFHAANA